MWSFFKRLFGGAPPPSPEQEAAIAAALERLKAEARPTLVLDAERGPPVLRLGGLPRLPTATSWPVGHDRPLAFIAEIDLAAVRRAEGPEWLPSRGFLHLFYNDVDQPWGFDPKDIDGWSIIYTQAAPASSRPRPDGLETVYRERFLSARRASSYPTPERLDVGHDIEVDYLDTVSEFLVSELGDEPEHRIGGYPSPIQNDDMELECQLASNGLNVGGPEAYQSEAAERLRSGAQDWRLLVQIDSDDGVGMMWGDVGRLYVWVREQDARAGDFGKAWVVLQCS